MKKILFVVSHLGSGSDGLVGCLDANPRVQVYNSGLVFDRLEAGLDLVALPHKCDTTAAFWAEHLLHNHRFSHRRFYDWAKFIYVIRDARQTLHALSPGDGSRAAANLRYYCYRLRRICEMARCTPGAVLLTWPDLHKPLRVVEDFLSLRAPLDMVPAEPPPASPFVTPEQVREGQACYERHFHYLRHQKLIRP